MGQYFYMSVRNPIKKGAFSALNTISAHEIASNKEKAHFLFEDCMIFMTGVGYFENRTCFEMPHGVFKRPFSLKLCLRCKGHIPKPSNMFGSAVLVH